MTQPFSLLLPVYGGDKPQYFERAFLSSVHEQEIRPDEAVVVVDGPVPDALEEVIARIKRQSPVSVQIRRLPTRGGLAAALSVGLASVTHDVVARMDADDISLPNRFLRQLPLIEDGFDIVGSEMVEFVEEGGEERIVGRRRAPGSQKSIERYARFHVPFHHPTVVFRRASVLAVGGYEAMGRMEDYWLWARLLQSGVPCMNVPAALVAYRVDAGSYQRRGGLRQLSSELALQRAMRRLGFTSRSQFGRNVLVRGGYRLLPEFVRRRAYRSLPLNRTSAEVLDWRGTRNTTKW